MWANSLLFLFVWLSLKELNNSGRLNSRKIFSLSSTPILNIKRETFDHLNTTTTRTTTSTPIPAQTDVDDVADKLVCQ